MDSKITKKAPAMTPAVNPQSSPAVSSATALKGVLASTKGKDLTFAQIRKAAAAAMKRKSMQTAKKKVNLFADLQQSLQGALAYEHGFAKAQREAIAAKIAMGFAQSERGEVMDAEAAIKMLRQRRDQRAKPLK